MAALHLIITGVVQGVGFRYAMCSQARRLGIRGWVRNRSEGTVEAVAVGESAALEALTTWAHQGPPGARVQQVHSRGATSAEAASADQPFTQRSTV